MDLSSLLRCPRCRGRLESPEADRFDCRTCRVRYRVTDGVPNLVPTDAEALPEGA